MHRQGRGERVVRPEAATGHRKPTRLDPVTQVRDRPGSERDVDERVALEDSLTLGFGVAATDGDDEIGLAPLARGGVPEVRGELRVRLLSDRARVEDEHVRLVRLRRLAESERLEHALDPLRVVSVHLTPERGDVIAPHRQPL